MAVASLVRDERSMSLALRRRTSVFEAQCSTRRRSPSSSCRRAEDTYKVNFERKSDQEVRANDPMVPFVVKAAGRMITRFQHREKAIHLTRWCSVAILTQSSVNCSGAESQHEWLLDVESAR